MEEISKATPVALASLISSSFEELKGRALAVVEIDPITRENKPTLPVCFVALIREIGNGPRPPSKSFPKPDEELMVSFAFEPARYKKDNGQESPFWSFIDYSALRDRMLNLLVSWKSPVGGRLSYQGLDIEADQFAVLINFKFLHSFDWCPDPVENLNTKWSMKTVICPLVDPPCFETKEEEP